jgi:hypothetical protein
LLEYLRGQNNDARRVDAGAIATFDFHPATTISKSSEMLGSHGNADLLVDGFT